VLRLLDFAFGFPGLIRGDRIMGRLHDLVGDRMIESLPVPFVAVATDIVRMREVWLTRGNLFDAIRASMAIPMIFTPHTVDGRELVDGGLMTPLPIAATRAMHVDRVIAVDVNAPVPWEHPWLPQRPEEATAKPAEVPVATIARGLRERISALWDGPDVDREKSPAGTRGVMDLMARSLDTMQARMTRLQIAQDPPDLLISVPGDVAMFHEFWRAKELVEVGREAARKCLDAAGL
jgi:NTE family protein